MDLCNYLISSLLRMLPKHRSEHKIWIANEEKTLSELFGSCQKRHSRYCQMLYSLQFLSIRASSLYRSLTGSVTVHSRLTNWKGKIEGRNLLETTVNLLRAETHPTLMELRQGHPGSSPRAVTVQGVTYPDLAACLHLHLPSRSHSTLTSWPRASHSLKTTWDTHRHTHPSKKHDSDELPERTGMCQRCQSHGRAGANRAGQG